MSSTLVIAADICDLNPVWLDDDNSEVLSRSRIVEGVDLCSKLILLLIKWLAGGAARRGSLEASSHARAQVAKVTVDLFLPAPLTFLALLS